ncbi:MAG TPA: UDP-N-acetylmuramoyl-L-alanine--D-glutamate ligase [Flavobacteriales bacterium]|nr:UDP-N-acetylmuramoyl-L-alanine--D-glutamate ligase [Flavobacteriales bacterium]HIN38961.1 UDP-N-acetylmuramoyl-L-alanine--D-glutamate ligase [Flavobacteriales bacterium]
MKLVVLGAGESGTGAAVLAKKEGFQVFVSDLGKVKEDNKNVLLNHEIDWEEEGHTEALILDADEVIKSPGIPEDAEIILKLKDRGVNVISEIEFAGRYSKAKMIGVTGSNGKTTTVHLLFFIMTNAGMDVGLAGNVGKSLALQVAENDREYFVVELSSFQLDGMEKFELDIGVLLNITPDHLDRYQGELKKYAEAKMKILQLVKDNGHFVYCLDDEIVANETEKRETNAKLIPFSIQKKLNKGAYIDNENLLIQFNQNQFIMLLQELALQGKHNIYNSMASGIPARILEIRKEIIRQSLSDFQNIEHRLEYVVKVHGIEFINDSKATNVNSTWYALETMVKPVVWIVGGVDKGNDYNVLKEMVNKKVKAIICISEDKKSNNKIKRAFSDDIEMVVVAESMEDAVKKAYHFGQKGDTVLLSPSCASFDRFKNYEERGWRFKRAVREL